MRACAFRNPVLVMQPTALHQHANTKAPCHSSVHLLHFYFREIQLYHEDMHRIVPARQISSARLNKLKQPSPPTTYPILCIKVPNSLSGPVGAMHPLGRLTPTPLKKHVRSTETT